MSLHDSSTVGFNSNNSTEDVANVSQVSEGGHVGSEMCCWSLKLTSDDTTSRYAVSCHGTKTSVMEK